MGVSGVTRYPDAASFLARAEDWLMAREAENNLLLGLCEQLMSRGEGSADRHFLATVDGVGGLTIAMLVTPYKAVVSRSEVSGAAALIAEDLFETGLPVPGALGPADQVASFAERWQQLSGSAVRTGEVFGIYELRRVVHPPYSSGRFRLADWGDVELLVQWREQFAIETDHQADPPEVNRSVVEAFVDEGTLYVWEDTQVVSMAAINRRTPRGRCIGMVYTPPSLRSRGYATSCMATLSQLILDQGSEFCCLFTQMSEPTPNAIYQRIGYRRVAEWTEVFFE